MIHYNCITTFQEFQVFFDKFLKIDENFHTTTICCGCKKLERANFNDLRQKTTERGNFPLG